MRKRRGGRKTPTATARLLGGLPITLPQPAPYQTRHVYNQFVIRAPRRDELKASCRKTVWARRSIIRCPCTSRSVSRTLVTAGDFPESERAPREVLALPVHSAMPDQDIEYVCEMIRAFYA